MYTNKEKAFTMNTVMVLKTLGLLPKCVLTIATSYLSADENELTKYITQRDFVQMKSQMHNFSKKQGHSSNNEDMNISDNEEDQDSETKTETTDAVLSKLSWKDSLKKCMDKALGLEKFSFSMFVRPEHSTSKTGQDIQYDISIVNSSSYCFSGDIIVKAIKETSLDTLNGNTMLYRFNLGLSVMLFAKDTAHLSNLMDQEDSNNDSEDEEGNYLPWSILDKKINFTYTEQENLVNNSTDVRIIEDANIVDSCIDRSYLFLAFCVNLIYTLKNITQNLKRVSPSDVNPDLIPKIKEAHAVKKGLSYDQKNDFVLGDNIRREVTSIKANPGDKSYDITTHLRKVRNSVGIWGSDCLFMDYIGSIRELNTMKRTGYDNVLDSTNVDNIQMLHSQNAGNVQNDTSSNFENDQQYQKFLKELDDNIALMCLERNTYCEATLNVVHSTYNELSNYINTCVTKYRDFMNAHTYSTTSYRKKFHDKIKNADLNRAMSMSIHNGTTTTTPNSTSSSEPESDIEKVAEYLPLRFRGSHHYEQTREKQTSLRKLLLKIMDENETVFFFGESMDPYVEEQNIKSGNGGGFWRRCFTTSILPALSGTFGKFVENQESKALSPEEKNLVFDKCYDYIGTTEEDKKVYQMLKEQGLEHMFYYIQHQDVTYEGKPYNMFCINGIPEAILYDEECLLKWLSLVSKSKTSSVSKAFRNDRNKNLPPMYKLFSSAWLAKTKVMLEEYEHMANMYDEKYFKKHVMANFETKDVS